MINCFELIIESNHKGYFSTHYKAHTRLREMTGHCSWEIRDAIVSINQKLDLPIKYSLPTKAKRISNMIGVMK